MKSVKSSRDKSSSSATTSGVKKKVSKGKAKKGGKLDYGTKRMTRFVKPLAKKALEFYNPRAGTNYVVVEDGLMKSEPTLLSDSLVFHINFVAKKTDNDEEEEEMFFAVITSSSGGNIVHVCVTLGSINSPSFPEINNHGCSYCRADCAVRHPKAVGWFEFY